MYLGAVFPIGSRVRVNEYRACIPFDIPVGTIGIVLAFELTSGVGSYKVQFTLGTVWLASHFLDAA